MADEKPGAEPPSGNLAESDPALQKKIEAAIEQGAGWLATLQKKDGSFGMPKGQRRSMLENTPRHVGLNALVVYTLAHCGHGRKHKVVKKALAWLKRKYAFLYKGDHLQQASTYSLSLFVLGLHQIFGRPPTEEHAHNAARYRREGARKKNPCKYPKWVRRAIWRTLDWLLETRSTKGLFRYPGGLPGGPSGGGVPPPGPGGLQRGHHFAGPEDLSCSQYVLLALWVGTRCGYKVPYETLVHIANRLLSIQEQDGPGVARVEDPRPTPGRSEEGGSRYAPPSRPAGGVVKDRARGFGYTPGHGATGAMTTAGLSSLMILKAILSEGQQLKAPMRTRLTQAIWDGIAWLQEHYTISKNHPVGAEWHYYYLYGLERALVIAGKARLGKNDWYREGAKLLVSAQKKDGRWLPSNSLGVHGPPGATLPICDTCFALLFLKRAALKPKKPVLDAPVVTGAK